MPADLTPSQLEAIEAQAGAATPGPWVHGGVDVFDSKSHEYEAVVYMPCHRLICVPSDECEDIQSANVGVAIADAEFIASARSDVPLLCQALRAAWEERDRMREALNWLLHLHHGISRGGDKVPVTDEEWHDAIKQAHAALTPPGEGAE